MRSTGKLLPITSFAASGLQFFRSLNPQPKPYTASTPETLSPKPLLPNTVRDSCLPFRQDIARLGAIVGLMGYLSLAQGVLGLSGLQGIRFRAPKTGQVGRLRFRGLGFKFTRQHVACSLNYGSFAVPMIMRRLLFCG